MSQVKVRFCGFVELEGRLLENALSVIQAVENHDMCSAADTKYPYIRYSSETSLELILSSNEPNESARLLDKKIEALPLVWVCNSVRYANTDNWLFSISFRTPWLKQRC